MIFFYIYKMLFYNIRILAKLTKHVLPNIKYILFHKLVNKFILNNNYSLSNRIFEMKLIKHFVT